MAVGDAPGRSSSVRKSRPSTGDTPNNDKKPEDTNLPCKGLGFPAPLKLKFSFERTADADANTLRSSRQSTKFGYETAPPAAYSPTITSCSGAWYGNGRNRTALTMLKIAVFAPIPKLSVSTAISVNPGYLRSIRPLYRRSCQIVSMSPPPLTS